MNSGHQLMLSANDMPQITPHSAWSAARMLPLLALFCIQRVAAAVLQICGLMCTNQIDDAVPQP
jgi:hypothetical protein